ncbi:MAG: aldo/keto reductase, partial [Chloroflexota bacterium]|nr:aldo/keto reductase [Chloroflexota bacterium]
GVTDFDTAPSYGNGTSEQSLGRVLRELRAWDRVTVGTKVQLRLETEDTLAEARRSIEQSLARLGRDSVDLLQLHTRIGAADADRALGIDRVLARFVPALTKLRDDGLIRHVGFTGMGDSEAVLRAASSGWFETVQCYFNAVNASAGYAGHSSGQQDFSGLIERAARAGLGVIAIRVMAAGALVPDRHPNAAPLGFLGGLVGQHEPARDLERAPRLAAMVQQSGLESVFELALRFVLSKPEVSTALVGFSSYDQLQQALRWAERGPLAPDVVAQVTRLTKE